MRGGTPKSATEHHGSESRGGTHRSATEHHGSESRGRKVCFTCYYDEDLGDQAVGNNREGAEEEGEHERKNGGEGRRQ